MLENTSHRTAMAASNVAKDGKSKSIRLDYLVPILLSATIMGCTVGSTQPIAHYLGSEEDAAALSATLEVKAIDQAELAKLSQSSDNIVIVDGREAVDAELLKAVVEAGNPLIALREPDSIKAMFADADRGAFSGIGLEAEDGLAEDGHAYAIYESPERATFNLSESDPVAAAEKGYEWAIRVMDEASERDATAEEAPIFHELQQWQSQFQRHETYESESGEFTIATEYLKLTNDNDSNSDYWL